MSAHLESKLTNLLTIRQTISTIEGIDLMWI